ncbi:hypothetical protein M529_12720 [Sphingobium ummariense RL-3]|uniref:GmrSD restriction endonucleases N-terminal domain-containing protein n=1 Tax=Sphingobium ummariense RL-3 TaxID=1346791 RepID=T0ISK4_9SPHN|nr:hypothetical protein M529_12720 [Sphingobium ummariense RL-3]
MWCDNAALLPRIESVNIDAQEYIRDDDVRKDEYELALEEGVDDETLREDPGATKFSISSYGADYTVDSLVKRMRGGAFRIPEFQRQFVWTAKHASKFIESLLMGLPVPGIFLYKEADTNEHLVIDGQQRLRTLEAFYDGLLRGKEFKLQGVREPWLNRTYKTLDPADVLKLDDSIVHATVFKQDKPEDVLDSIYFVFERINTGGIRLSPQEIRNCVSLGPFIERVRELNKFLPWRQVFAGQNNRAKDEELIVRFFAMYRDGDKYSRPMNGFLNKFSAAMNKVSKDELDQLSNVFRTTIEKVNTAIGVRAFRIIRALNAAAFDAVMVGLAKRLDTGPAPADHAVSGAYDVLVANDEFRQACERATADEENVRKRLALATAAFAGI